MILIIAFILGVALGAVRARRRGGNRADIVQYGLAHGVAALVLTAGVALIAALAGFSPG
ncbi:MAG: hypothetical protein COW75_00150 [Rhodobacterales bacterium CG18_big_fil_WC_8_21_14_2_50_71_9]|nr:MAG: hypothetical protein COW75_00150 [Rhodobacterales bacterium CG18_big_fil_WC_8_21_14_2_50_71_9]PJA59971.1 MAG: hypothetical protein CO163_06315 [Rhodobacterales bacterium CG_4_9_14_3_um_filter_71_31]